MRLLLLLGFGLLLQFGEHTYAVEDDSFTIEDGVEDTGAPPAPPAPPAEDFDCTWAHIWWSHMFEPMTSFWLCRRRNHGQNEVGGGSRRHRLAVKFSDLN
eukprot:SAG11_NODE_2671_length_3110_cov_3.724012_2_plen_100_part_00